MCWLTRPRLWWRRKRRFGWRYMPPAGQAKLQEATHKLLPLALSPRADRCEQGQSQMANSKQHQGDEYVPPAVRSLLLFMFLLGGFLLMQQNNKQCWDSPLSLPSRTDRNKMGFWARVEAELKTQLILRQVPLARGPARCYSIIGTWLWQQDPGLTSTHHHHGTAGAAANIQAGTPKSGWKRQRWHLESQSESTWVHFSICMPARGGIPNIVVWKQAATAASTPDRNYLSKPFVTIAMIPEYTFQKGQRMMCQYMLERK